MDGVVHDAKDNSRGCLGDIAVPAIGQNRNVVVPVQQDEGLFVNENKEGVNQFSVFRKKNLEINAQEEKKVN